MYPHNNQSFNQNPRTTPEPTIFGSTTGYGGHKSPKQSGFLTTSTICKFQARCHKCPSTICRLDKIWGSACGYTATIRFSKHTRCDTNHGVWHVKMLIPLPLHPMTKLCPRPKSLSATMVVTNKRRNVHTRGNHRVKHV